VRQTSLLIILTVVTTVDARATQIEDVRFSGEYMTYDRNTGIFSTFGNVKVDFAGNRVDGQDGMSYSTVTRMVNMDGGIIVNAPKARMTTDGVTMDTATGRAAMNNISAELGETPAQMAYLKADSGLLEENRKLRLSRVEYTACEEGRIGCDSTPTWHISASEVGEDLESRAIWFRHAFLRMWGVPVFYMPIFFGYDPTVDNRSGLLVPGLSFDAVLGTVVSQPLYISLTPYTDMTITPTMTTQRGTIWRGEYRTNQKSFEHMTRGSFKRPDEHHDQSRWYVNSKTMAELNDVWRAYLNIERTSDNTYLRIYELDQKPWTTTAARLEGTYNRSYLTLQSYIYQDLRNLPGSYNPLVLPVLNYKRVLDPNSVGGTFALGANSARIIREYIDSGRKDENYLRGSASLRYEQPWRTDSGQVLTMAATAEGDFYSLDDTAIGDAIDDSRYTGTEAQGNITASVRLESPMYRSGKNGASEILEPIVQVLSSPKYSGNPRIPNFDSKFMELDVMNLFEENRFAGFDLFESGTRTNYGVRYTRMGSPQGATVSFFVGQNYNIDVPGNVYLDNNGLANTKGFSDTVASIFYSPSKFIKANYRTRIEQETLTANRHDLSLIIGPPALRLDTNYVYFKQMYVEDDLPVQKDELNARLSTQLTRFWSAYVWNRHNLITNRTLTHGAGFAYEDSCFRLGINYFEELTRDADYIGNRAITFTLTYKSLGTVASGFSVGANQ